MSISVRHVALAAGLLCGACAGVRTTPPEAADRPLVGAIRWDGWNAWDHFTRSLEPAEWHDRLPFFADRSADGHLLLREDSPAVMEREIKFAYHAGLDFWAFVWYHPEGWPPHSRDMGRCLELYLSSPNKSDIHYCLIISGGPHLGPKDQLPLTIDRLVRHFGDPSYQRVMGGRPLVFFFQMANVISYMGTPEAAHSLLTELRGRSVAAGAGDPYFVTMTFNPPEGAEQALTLGCDAIGSYAGHGRSDNREYPYEALAEYNRAFWERCKATGREVVPVVNAGWDFRPMKREEYPERDRRADWFRQPTPDELAEHLEGALAWTRQNPSSCRADTVLVYAWNELAEGGWLVPTLSEGTARLDALRRVLRPNGQTTSSEP